MHFKHELMEGAIYRKKNQFHSAQALVDKIQLIMGLEVKHFKIKKPKLSERPDIRVGTNKQQQYQPEGMLNENVWEEKIEIPYFLQYTNELDYEEAKKCH